MATESTKQRTIAFFWLSLICIFCIDLVWWIIRRTCGTICSDSETTQSSFLSPAYVPWPSSTASPTRSFSPARAMPSSQRWTGYRLSEGVLLPPAMPPPPPPIILSSFRQLRLSARNLSPVLRQEYQSFSAENRLKRLKWYRTEMKSCQVRVVLFVGLKIHKMMFWGSRPANKSLLRWRTSFWPQPSQISLTRKHIIEDEDVFILT